LRLLLLPVLLHTGLLLPQLLLLVWLHTGLLLPLLLLLLLQPSALLLRLPGLEPQQQLPCMWCWHGPDVPRQRQQHRQ
jgi:hypothetical protein